jgi:hypothetical protein
VEQDDQRDEIIRLRDRNHDVLSAITGLRFQVEDLREWRAETRTQLGVLSRRCDELAEQIDRVLKADEIADAVANRMAQQNTLRLTVVQKAAAFMLAAVALAGGIKGLVS